MKNLIIFNLVFILISNHAFCVEFPNPDPVVEATTSSPADSSTTIEYGNFIDDDSIAADAPVTDNPGVKKAIVGNSVVLTGQSEKKDIEEALNASRYMLDAATTEEDQNALSGQIVELEKKLTSATAEVGINGLDLPPETSGPLLTVKTNTTPNDVVTGSAPPTKQILQNKSVTEAPPAAKEASPVAAQTAAGINTATVGTKPAATATAAVDTGKQVVASKDAVAVPAVPSDKPVAKKDEVVGLLKKDKDDSFFNAKNVKEILLGLATAAIMYLGFKKSKESSRNVASGKNTGPIFGNNSGGDSSDMSSGGSVPKSLKGVYSGNINPPPHRRRIENRNRHLIEIGKGITGNDRIDNKATGGGPPDGGIFLAGAFTFEVDGSNNVIKGEFVLHGTPFPVSSGKITSDGKFSLNVSGAPVRGRLNGTTISGKTMHVGKTWVYGDMVGSFKATP